MYQELIIKYRQETESLKKFFIGYTNASLFYNSNIPGLNHINFPPGVKEKILNGNFTVKNLDRAPIGGEEIPGIQGEFKEIKSYMLEEGQRKIFDYTLILMYSYLESFIRECSIKRYGTFQEECRYLGKRSLKKLNISLGRSTLNGIIRIREIRNCIIHNNGIWDEKGAKILSKAYMRKEDKKYPLELVCPVDGVYRTEVGEKIKLPINSTSIVIFLMESTNLFYNEIEKLK